MFDDLSSHDVRFIALFVGQASIKQAEYRRVRFELASCLSHECSRHRRSNSLRNAGTRHAHFAVLLSLHAFLALVHIPLGPLDTVSAVRQLYSKLLTMSSEAIRVSTEAAATPLPPAREIPSSFFSSVKSW